MSFDLSAAASTVTSLVQNLVSEFTSSRDTFELRAGPYLGQELRVVSWCGTEAISELFEFDIVVVSKLAPVILQPTILGQSACLSLQLEGQAARNVQGIISSIEVLGCRRADELYVYRVRLVPRMWLLSQRRGCRIFQDQSASTIIDSILAEHNIVHRWANSRVLPKRDYCVQYEETDLEFVSRLLAEEGVYYYFDQPTGWIDELLAGVSGAVTAVVGALSTVAGAGESASDGLSEVTSALDEAGMLASVVFGDTAEYPVLTSPLFASISASVSLTSTGTVTARVSAATPTLPYQDGDGLRATEEHIYQFVLGRQLRPKSAVVREFTPAKPLLAVTERSLGRKFQISATSSQLFASAATTFAGSDVLQLDQMAIGHQATKLEYYDPIGTAQFDPSAERARRILDGVRRDAIVAHGASSCRRLSAGYKFQLSGHAVDVVNGPYVPIRVVHAGQTPELQSSPTSTVDVYSNRFECVPATVRVRPPPSHRRPRQVVETATVVGPAEEEIHTDEMGRVKVQFHWDRDGKKDDASSCWIRVSQTWAGSGWGFQFVPRVGMEAVVTFLFGDVDRPIVTGCVANAVNIVPYALPEQRSTSGIRTRSTPGGDGYNELLFDDSKGAEVVYLRGERDLVEEVGRNRVIHVGFDGTGDSNETVATDYVLDVGRDRRDTTKRNSQRSVGGNEQISIGGRYSHFVASDRRETTIGLHTINAVGGLSASSAGNLAITVRGNAEALVRGHKSDTILGDARVLVANSSSMSVGGSLSASATQDLSLEAGHRFRISCGKSSIEMTSESIVLRAPSVTVTGDVTSIQASGTSLHLEEQEARLHASSAIELNSGDTLDAFAKDAHLSLGGSSGGEVALTAKHVLLSGESSKLDLTADATLQATNVHLNPGDGIDSGQSSSATPDELKTSWVAVSLVTADGKSVSGARYQIKMSNEDVVEGVLSGSGAATVPVVPGAAWICFTDFEWEAWGGDTSGCWLTGATTATPYTVLDGEDAYTISDKFGFPSHDAVWNADENANLRSLRDDPGQLFPGDLLFIPPRSYGVASLSEQSTTTFTLTQPSREFVMTLSDADGKPRSGVAYKLSGESYLYEGSTAEDGSIKVDIPARVKIVNVIVDGVVHVVSFGGLNPMRNTPDGGASGVAQRLAARGYDPGPSDGTNATKLAAAVCAYQKAQGLSETGAIDDALFDSLEATE